VARAILTDDLWQRVEHCMPPTPHRRRVPGPHPISDRAVLAGILFVLKSGLPWDELPGEMGAGSGMTCLRRLRKWQQEGRWKRIRRALAGAFARGEVDWRRAEDAPLVRRLRPQAERAVRTGLARRRAEAAATAGASLHHDWRAPHAERSRRIR
jgi:transposase